MVLVDNQLPPHLLPWAKGRLHCAATYTTFFMLMSFSMPGVMYVLQMHGISAPWMALQQTVEGGTCGPVSATYCAHWSVSALRSPLHAETGGVHGMSWDVAELTTTRRRMSMLIFAMTAGYDGFVLWARIEQWKLLARENIRTVGVLVHDNFVFESTWVEWTFVQCVDGIGGVS